MSDSALKRIRRDGRIAIHYPNYQGKEPRHRQGDNKSLRPSDYTPKEGRFIQRFAELAQTGGYVFSEFEDGWALAGYVQPLSDIEFRTAPYSSDPKQTATLKTLKLNPSIELRTLSAKKPPIPKRGTIYRWHRGGDLVIDLLERRHSFKSEFDGALPEIREFIPPQPEAAKRRVLQSIALRQGQKKFRHRLLQAYQGKCAITGDTCLQVLEAAHILPHRNADTFHPANGILLRSDLHVLFDLDLIRIQPGTLRVIVSRKLRASVYWHYHRRRILVPSRVDYRPSALAIRMRFDAI